MRVMTHLDSPVSESSQGRHAEKHNMFSSCGKKQKNIMTSLFFADDSWWSLPLLLVQPHLYLSVFLKLNYPNAMCVFPSRRFSWGPVILTGWWLGTFFHILGISSSQLTNSYFSKGLVYHQPDLFGPSHVFLNPQSPFCHKLWWGWEQAGE